MVHRNGYKVAIVGIGAVGTEMIKILRERNFPAREIQVMARSERDEEIAGELYHVIPATADAFEGIDYAFFAGTEGAKGASQLYGWEAVKRGATVIDNGDDFRMDPRVPLVIPEINPEALQNHQGLIANPNCSTSIVLMALAPLHKAAGIRRVVAATYQAVSGTGRAAVTELQEQVAAYVRGEALQHDAYPHQIAFNALAQVGSAKPEMPGYTSEEAKLLFETRKILGDERIQCSATCVRIPVFTGHAAALNVQFERELDPQEARRIIAAAPGVKLVDELDKNLYPQPLATEGEDEIRVGRIRSDLSAENALSLFVAGDNLRKGAALNAIQIAETLIGQKQTG